MAYGSARYNSYQKKDKGVILSEVQSSQYGQKNTGSALGYIGGNFAAGLGGIVEGLSDLFVAGGSALVGDFDYAKYVFKDNVVGDWHESITDDYNPGKVMEFVGNVSHGLGQSSVFLLDAVGVPVGTVGFFGGMIGQGISGAAEKTGDVGFKEVAYGALSGAAEGVLEKAMGGMSKLAGNIASPVVKNVGKTAVRKGLLKQVLSDAGSEFAEEFLSEYLDSFLQRVTKVDTSAQTSLKDAIYSGFVGAVSGGLSAGAGDVARYAANQRNGARIIKSGNAQTLINTATTVADKLAGSGTDFKNAAEWVKTLRGEVNAYNKLKDADKAGAKGQTILGEMQASLYFAETQATFSGVLTGIQNADEEKRAALAEYVNLTVDKKNRKKDYTAEDVAKNTDNIAWQLSVLHYVNNIFDIDAAMAQESAIEGVIKEEQGASSAQVPQAAQAPTVQVPQAAESVTVDLGDGETLTFSEAKEPLPTREQKLERARLRAEKWKSFEEKTGATVQEMNKARSYVKDFDALENRNRLAILQTIRSAERSGTKVDELTVKGIANVMAARTAKGQSFAGDLEVRFADGISQSGLYTHADGKPVIVINAKADSKEALRSTVAHELVHYLETRAGYNSLAAYVWQTARAEKRDAIRKEYEDFYKENEIEYSEEDIHSEIVARLVGERLQSEKFLKRYAEKDASMIKRAAGFIKDLRKATKDADEEAERITGEIMLRMDRALAGADVKESDGGKRYNLDEKLGEQLQEWLENGGKKGTKYNGVYFDLGTTPDVFIKHGAKKVNMIMFEDVVAKVTGMKGDVAHTISIDEIAKLPSQLNDPILLFKGSVPGSFVALTELTDKYGNDVVVAVHINRTNVDHSKITKIASLYSKTNEYGKNKIESFVNKQIESNNLIDASIKKASNWFTTRGLQLPKAVQTILDANNSIPQKQDLSTPAAKKYDLKKKKAEGEEEVSESFKNAVARMYEKDAKQAQNTAEAFKEGNRVLNKKLEESRAETERYKAKGRSLARKIAEDAYEEDAKTFTQKEVDELIGRINSYSTEKFKDIMNEKSATLSKADKEQFAFDIYVAFHVASADSHAIERIGVLADKLARQYLDNVYYTDDGSRFYLNEVVDEATYEQYVKTFRRKIMASFKSMGRETTHARLTAAYRAEMAKLQKQLLDAEAKGKNLRELQWQAKKLRTDVDIQKRSPQDEGIYNVEKEMSRIADERGRISAKQADKAFDQMHVFLTSDSGKVDSALEELAQVEGESLISLIEEYKHSREKSKSKYLSSSEMALAAKIIAGGRKILREYNRVFYNGHWEDMGKLATESVTDLKAFAGADREYKTKVGKWLGEKVGKTIQQTYFYNVLSPETVVEALEGYKKNGVLKTLYHAVREATQKAEHMAVQMKKPFAEYLDDKENAWTDEDGKKHSFRDKLNDKTVVVNGNEITLGEAIYLYMLMKREHSHLGLQESGFVTYDENNQSKREFKILDIDAAMGQIDNQLDSTDKAFLKMAETFFNETASKIKYDADMKILGYTNNQEGYYVPIIRDRYEHMANVTDKRQSIGSIATVYNKSFTQNLVKNQKALEGKNIMAIINDHADGLADYSELYLPLKSFDRVYNTRVITDTAQATSIRKVLNDKVWKGTDTYFKNLFADIQGQSKKRDTLDQVVGKLRSGWVNSVLGLNLKVVATQTTSFVAANQVIEMKYLAPALQKFVGDVSELGARADEYSDIIEARSFEMGALRAQGNIDKVAKWSEKSGFMINWMDRRVCLAIFHAAELKAEAEGAGAVGTVENAQAAAKIADEVIYTTQAMTSQAERSALQRHKSEIAKMFAMFTSDSVKQLSHFYGNVMRYVAHKERAKTDATYEAELKKDAKAMGRSATTLVATGVMLGIITQAFKYLYAKEEEEPEEKAKDFAIDMISSTFNILPIVSDVMDKFVFGYDLSLNVLDIANDTIEDTSKLFSMAGKAMSGEFVSNADVGKNVINTVKTYATIGGVPVSPVERTVTGLMRRFTPSTIYGYDAMFANPSYTSDLKDAVENGNERLAEHILERLYRSEATGVYNSAELEEVARLFGAGYENVLPQKVGESVNGVKLTRAQRRQFNSIYAGASAAVERMMATEVFAGLTDEGKAKAIKNLYSLYYNRAASATAGEEWSNAQAYAALLGDASALFTSQAYKSGLEAYESGDGKQVTVKEQFVAWAQNLGLSEAELSVILYANGVRDKASRERLLAVINTAGLSDEDKAKIAEKLGFVIKNGTVVADE